MLDSSVDLAICLPNWHWNVHRFEVDYLLRKQMESNILSPTSQQSWGRSSWSWVDGGANIAKKNSKNNTKSYREYFMFGFNCGAHFGDMFIFLISCTYVLVPFWETNWHFTYGPKCLNWTPKDCGLVSGNVSFHLAAIEPICSVQTIASNSSWNIHLVKIHCFFFLISEPSF